MASLATGAVTSYMAPHLIKHPMYDLHRTGEVYIQELLQAYPDRIRDTLGVSNISTSGFYLTS